MPEPIYYFTKRKLQLEKRKLGKRYEKLLFKAEKTMVENVEMETCRNKIVELDNQIKEINEKR